MCRVVFGKDFEFVFDYWDERCVGMYRFVMSRGVSGLLDIL